VRFLLSKIKDKDHTALVKFLGTEQALNELEEPFNLYKQMDVASLTRLIQANAKELTLAAIAAVIFIVQSVSAGEPLRLQFTPRLDAHAYNHELAHDDEAWLAAQVGKLTDEKITVNVSEWAEAKRYLPPQVTSMPGFYSYDVAPFLREIADCLSLDSPVRELDFMKGAQVGATVGILENAIGYVIDHVKTAPTMLLTADAELAQLRMESYITPMLQYSDLMDLIQSADTTNSRKTGKTDKKLEWAGGGFLVPFGARNADKLRSISMQYLLEDECDAFPDTVGKDGDPQKLAEARTKAYHESRKIARVSTPLLLGSSRIKRGFDRGDQRRYHVPCKKCEREQVLVFQGGRSSSKEKQYGLTWEISEHGAVVPDSVRYVCKFCGHKHRNADKSWMLPRGRWIPTSVPRDPEHRSYHISALYSPVGMFPWEAIVRDWLEAWDEDNNQVRDVTLLQEFYNNNLGEPFEVRGSKIRFTSVSAHRRPVYKLGQVPNVYAKEYCGSPILFLTCQVDVHKNNLAVAVMGWTRDAKCFVIDYWRFEVEKGEDDCSELTSPVWGRLRALIEEIAYKADDGKVYRLTMTLVDAGYANDTVSNFCADYASGVYPILGRDRPAKNQTIKEFAEFKTQVGTVGYRILVDHYKDRIAPVLRREWSEDTGAQKRYHFNAPVDLTDKQLKELTVESRREKLDDNGNTIHYWHRPGNAKNELWDLMVYGHAAVEILAWAICIQHFELETIDWSQFWDYVEGEALYYEE
jgi:phage terminase large subunit GpA-like protein